MSEELREAIETDAYEYIDDDYITRDIDLAREIAYQEIYDQLNVYVLGAEKSAPSFYNIKMVGTSQENLF